MEEKKSIKITMLLTILGVVVVATGISFAIFSQVINSNKSQIIQTGKVSFELTEPTNGIELNNLQEMTDYEGLAQEEYYEFTLKNNGDTLTNYQIFLIDDIIPSSYMGTVLDDKYIKVGLEVNGIVSEVINLETANRMIKEDSLEVGKTNAYKLRVWLNYDGLTDEEKKTLIGQSIFVKLKVIGTQELNLNLDTSGANAPELATGMIPVYYDSTNDVWRKADKNNSNSSYRWYSYESSGSKKGMWANAVTVTETNRTTYLNAALGTAISMDDINTMFVWIPRFSAVTPSNYNGGTQAAPGSIDVTFVNKSKTALDAFWWDENSNGVEDVNEQKSGFWFGKFEVSSDITCTAADNSALGSGCNLNTIKPIIKPNAQSWRGAQVITYFTTSRTIGDNGNIYGFVSSEVDTHMLKNNEWGAAAYLTQSIYGRCTSSTSCAELTMNFSYYTGDNDYKININQSTTGTIYGIYDMNGGAWEYAMDNYADTTSLSGFASTWFTNNAKYYNKYTDSTYTGHALTETSGWYSDYAYFVNLSNPWFVRGGCYGNGSSGAGVFSFSLIDGAAYTYISSRVTIIK